MAKRKILTTPDPMLGMKSKVVEDFDARLHQLLDDMAETMKDIGIGLAAVQVGVLYRVAVLDDMNGGILELVNPVIIKASKYKDGEEGCLSCPNVHVTKSRAQEITVKALDRNGKSFTMNMRGMLAVCAQHEIDHMDGITLVSEVS